MKQETKQELKKGLSFFLYFFFFALFLALASGCGHTQPVGATEYCCTYSPPAPECEKPCSPREIAQQRETRKQMYLSDALFDCYYHNGHGNTQCAKDNLILSEKLKEEWLWQ